MGCSDQDVFLGWAAGLYVSTETSYGCGVRSYDILYSDLMT